MFAHHFLELIIFIVVLYSKANAIDLPKITTASMYETPDKTGRSVSFVDDMELWSNFQKMFYFANMTNPTTICVRGAWLVYQNPDFRTKTTEDVHLFSGNENCVQPEKIQQYGSMQPIGPYKFRKNSITVFEKKLFGSFGLSYFPKGKEVKKFRKSWLPTVESFITTGKSSWTLLDNDGTAYCIKPQSTFEHPICLLIDLSQFNQIKKPNLVAVIENCNKDNQGSGTNNSLTIELSNCKEFGGPKFEKIENMGASGRSVEKRVSDGMEKNATCIRELDEDLNIRPMDRMMVKKFAKLRLTHDFSSKEQLLWPERKKDIWKTEMIDTVFDIVMMTCPGEIVPAIYLQLIREFTISYLDQAWKKMENDTMKITPEVQDLTDSLNECLVKAVDQRDPLNSGILEHFNSFREPGLLDKEIYSVFSRNPKFDPVLESAWLVINYGLAICHHLHDYAINFWPEYINIFRDLYILPLIEPWQNPKLSPRSFKAVMGGFGMENQFKRLAYCTTIAFDLTPNLPPIEKKF